MRKPAKPRPVPAVRICPVCLKHVEVGLHVYTHLDTAGGRCPMSLQPSDEGVMAVAS